MTALLDVILPVFLIIGFGYAAAYAKLFDDGAVDGLMRFAQNFAAPCLLFKSVAQLDLASAYHPALFASFYAGAFAGFGLGYFGANKLFNRTSAESVAIGFACMFSNSLLLGLPITERAYGADALSGNYAIISIHAPLLYGFGITVMELVRSKGAGLSVPRLTSQVLRAIFSQPLVLGIVAGFAVNLSGLAMPAFAWSAVNMIAGTAIPAALFGLGGVLRRYRPEGDMKCIAMVCALSLIVHPAVTYLLGRYGFGLPVPDLRSAVVTGAMAPGVNAYLFANIYGVSKRVAASAVLIGTLATIITAWGWLAILP
jgi:malonate transporter and related proteins